MLTRMLVRPVNLNFSKSGGDEIFIEKTGRSQPKQALMKIAKKKIDYRLFLYSLSQYLYQQKFFGVLLIYWMLNADIFIHLCSTRIMLFDRDFRIIMILYLTEADVQHLQTESQQHNFPFPISPQVKTADFKVPEHTFQYDDVDNASYFHTAGNEAVKPILLFFNGFHRTLICQFIFKPIQDGRRVDAKRPPTSFPQHFLTFSFNPFATLL